MNRERRRSIPAEDDELLATDLDDEAPVAKRAKKKAAKSAQPRLGVAGDVILSSDYACTECGLSFDAPTRNCFSFNSPQGMCPTCSGLGEVFTFDPFLLAPDKNKSFKDGAIELVGKWKEMGRWRRHIYQGVADTMERIHEWDEGTLLETPWEQLTEEQQGIWLNGTGSQHITFTWRGGGFAAKIMVEIGKA